MNTSTNRFDVSKGNAHGLDILLIEDHEEMRIALEMNLGHLGNRCFSASSLKEAKALLDTFEIDLIICDFHLPDGNGFTLNPDLSDAFSRVPKILITGDSNAFIPSLSRAGGYDACLRKPLHMDELTEVIERLVT